MMLRLRSYLTALFLLAASFGAQAQVQLWNAALDRYEYICRRCADWRDRLDRGMPVPKDSLKLLTKELSGLKQNLQYALGDMTPGQRRRFESTRDWFTTGEWPQYMIETVGPAAKAPECRPKPPRGWVAEPAGSIAPPYHEATVAVPCGHVHAEPIAGLSMGIFPDLSYGLLAGIGINRWGVFLKGRSNFHAQKCDYDCHSDGTTADGFFWSGGEKIINRHQLTLDLSFSPAWPLSLYAGAGYGIRTLCWKDSGGQWARVSDRSYSGLALDAGLLVHPVRRGPARGLTLLLGGSWIPGGSRPGYFDAEAALAWRFY